MFEPMGRGERVCFRQLVSKKNGEPTESKGTSATNNYLKPEEFYPPVSPEVNITVMEDHAGPKSRQFEAFASAPGTPRATALRADAICNRFQAVGGEIIYSSSAHTASKYKTMHQI